MKNYQQGGAVHQGATTRAPIKPMRNDVPVNPRSPSVPVAKTKPVVAVERNTVPKAPPPKSRSNQERAKRMIEAKNTKVGMNVKLSGIGDRTIKKVEKVPGNGMIRLSFDELDAGFVPKESERKEGRQVKTKSLIVGSKKLIETT